MELVVSARLTSAERVAMGVGTSSRGAGTETNSLTGRLRTTLRSNFGSISTSAPLNQDGGVIGKLLKQRIASEISLLFSQNGNLNRYLRHVVRQFDGYEKQFWYRFNS